MISYNSDMICDYYGHSTSYQLLYSVEVNIKNLGRRKFVAPLIYFGLPDNHYLFYNNNC